jgi:hypothetical protein
VQELPQLRILLNLLLRVAVAFGITRDSIVSKDLLLLVGEPVWVVLSSPSAVAGAASGWPSVPSVSVSALVSGSSAVTSIAGRTPRKLECLSSSLVASDEAGVVAAGCGGFATCSVVSALCSLFSAVGLPRFGGGSAKLEFYD